MIRKCVFLSNGFMDSCTGIQHNQFAQAMKHNGVEFEFVNAAELGGPQLSALLNELTEPRDDHLLVTFNGRIDFPKQKPGGEPYEIRWHHLCWLVDDPVQHFASLISLPANTVMGVVEPFHADILKQLGCAFKSVQVPHSNLDPLNEIIPIAKRQRRVLFAGSIAPLPDWADMKRINPPQIHPFLEASEQCGQDQAARPQSVFDAFDQACKERSIDHNQLPKQVLSGLLMLGEMASNSLARRRVLRILQKHMPIDLIGNIDDPELLAMDDVTFLGRKDFQEVLEISSHLKANICLTPKFPSAITERIWGAIASGTPAFCSLSTGLDEFEESVCQLDLSQSDATLEEKLLSVLEDDVALQMMQEGALAKVAPHHHYIHHVAKILDFFNQA
ncbi:hypothetical protein MTBPR1_70109 [Candidatus Terasakiella magnetica]|uniref:Spore protein YkvP/CgeB glycosyl transferase-like domain-containing protein n=1 Tax=Candidatus Terasakiella magnetica TaxID=1867952 RepID=A0A1C3RKP1_9PROT|nr:glycosyltransferase [Candidatus Terasakiella magnetica]SCA57837.1 hypothetical protein MTBPR1_70109 [Candidatus Terasakiella magnetica]